MVLRCYGWIVGSLFTIPCSLTPLIAAPAHLSVLSQIWAAPGNRGRRLSALIRALRWFVRCHRSPSLTDPVLLPVFDQKRHYPCHVDSIIAKHVMYRSEWFDWDMLQFLRSYLQPSDHFLDIGANTGLHTLLASTRIDPAAGGQIICIEPDPRNVQRLRHTLGLNHLDHVTVHPVAAAAQAGKVSLTGSDVFTRIANPVAGFTNLVAGVCDPGTPESTKKTTCDHAVDAIPLDDLLGDLTRPIAVCKIDVEGAEWEVLKGAQRLIASGRLPLLILELRGHLQAFGQNETDFITWLQAQGYRLARYQHDRGQFSFTPPFPEDVFALSDTAFETFSNRLPSAYDHKHEQ